MRWETKQADERSHSHTQHQQHVTSPSAFISSASHLLLKFSLATHRISEVNIKLLFGSFLYFLLSSYIRHTHSSNLRVRYRCFLRSITGVVLRDVCVSLCWPFLAFICLASSLYLPTLNFLLNSSRAAYYCFSCIFFFFHLFILFFRFLSLLI